MKKFFLLTITTLFLATVTYAYTTLEAKAIVAAAAIKSEGYTIKGSKSGCLSRNGHAYRSTYLYSGIDYVIIGVADNISDLDATLYDENWRVVASDYSSGSVSQVNIRPSWDGKFYIKTKAYSGKGCYAQVIGWK